MEQAKAILEVFKASELDRSIGQIIDDELPLKIMEQAKAILEVFKASEPVTPGVIIDNKLPETNGAG